MAVNSKKLKTLVDWLNLVPYFTNHADSSLMEAAENLGVDAQELLKVMKTLTCLGVGKYHGELFDMEVNYKGVHIIDDLGLNQPLRLTPTEASTYLLTLEALAATPGLVNTDAVLSASKKLRSIMDKRAMAIYDSLTEPDQKQMETCSKISQAVENGVQLKIVYWSSSSDKTSTRVIDPKQVFVREDDVYLRAWQGDIAQWRTFRVDRIQSLEVLDSPADINAVDEDFDLKNPFGFKDHTLAQLELDPECSWLAEHFDITLGEPLENGRLSATMAVGSQEWFIRFALGQADRLVVVGPQEIAEAVADAAHAALASYTK